MTLNVPCCWYSPLGRTSKPPLHMAIIMASDDLATPGTKAPTPIYNNLVLFSKKAHQSISICIIDQYGYETRCWNCPRNIFNELSPGMRWHSSHRDGCRSESGDCTNFIPEPNWHRSEYIHTILWWGTLYLKAHHNCVKHYGALIVIGHYYSNVVIMLIPTTGAIKDFGVYVFSIRNICPHTNVQTGVFPNIILVPHLCFIPVYAAGAPFTKMD